ncbi:IS607 family element RNA-guided endonuclease TnpB [Nocardia sp. NPDC059239]|uniref:IS607 family element RNA-guided endonuclease TnpB n=1 Tax=unclassified Nocardia TaxID=2637762 RepID=UPI0036CF0E80
MSESGSAPMPSSGTAGTTVSAYRFVLEPTFDQEEALRSHCGAARFAYNWGIRKVLANWNQRRAEASYGIPDDELTPWIDLSAYGLRRAWNAEQERVAPWWRENSKEAYASGLAQLADAFANHRKSKRGTRSGPPMGLPRHKKKHARQSFTVTTGSYGLDDGYRRVKIPRIGSVRTGESTRKLGLRLANETARLGSMTISYSRGRWWVSFTVRLVHSDRQPVHPDARVGVDLGLKCLAVTSQEVPGVTDAEGRVANSRHYQRAQRHRCRLARACARRRGPDHQRGVAPSKRWLKANAKAARLEHRVAAMRRDGVHKLTTALASRCGVVVVEDLNVAGMLKNRRLAKHIADAGFGELRRQLGYKTRRHGGTLVVADRFYPSSKTCSSCGFVKAKLTLSERIFVCGRCGLVLDRDLNAARNLAKLASTQSCGGTVNMPDGNRVRPGSPGSGTATGRPETAVAGQPCLSNQAGHGTRQSVNGTHQLDISYRETGDDAAGLRAGDRAPDAPLIDANGKTVRLFDLFRGPHATLLLFGPDTTADRAGSPAAELRTVRLVRAESASGKGEFTDAAGDAQRAYDAADGSWVLVRPDGYVGSRSTPTER